MSSQKFTGATTMRDTLNEARKSTPGRRKIKQFANDGNFLNIVRWTQDQGKTNDTFTLLKKITDEFYDQNRQIKEFLEMKTYLITKKNK